MRKCTGWSIYHEDFSVHRFLVSNHYALFTAHESIIAVLCAKCQDDWVTVNYRLLANHISHNLSFGWDSDWFSILLELFRMFSSSICITNVFQFHVFTLTLTVTILPSPVNTRSSQPGTYKLCNKYNGYEHWLPICFSSNKIGYCLDSTKNWRRNCEMPLPQWP